MKDDTLIHAKNSNKPPLCSLYALGTVCFLMFSQASRGGPKVVADAKGVKSVESAQGTIGLEAQNSELRRILIVNYHSFGTYIH